MHVCSRLQADTFAPLQLFQDLGWWRSPAATMLGNCSKSDLRIACSPFVHDAVE